MNLTNNVLLELKDVVSQFDINGEIESIDKFGSGHINDTFKVRIINSETAFLLQKINHHIFPDIDGLMKNIQLVTDHLKSVLASVVNEVEKHTLTRSEEHTSELQSGEKLECRLLLVRNN